jgi:uncharacterized surface protein with fasciclin (FAS1) repeats
MNKWIWVVIAAIVIIAGVWFFGMRPASTTDTTGGDMASTTGDMASTTTATPVVVEPAKTSSSVAAVVAGLSGASEYAGLFSSTGVGATLTGKGPYTVFVSTDAGYALLKPGTITNMTAAQKKRLIQYSIVSGRMLNISATDSGTITALSKDTLNFNVNDSGLVQVNSSFALRAIKASNGIVYIINQPLLPPVSATAQ